MLLMANAGLLERTAGTAPTAWRRHLGYLLDGLRAPVAADVDTRAHPAGDPAGDGRLRSSPRLLLTYERIVVDGSGPNR